MCCVVNYCDKHIWKLWSVGLSRKKDADRIYWKKVVGLDIYLEAVVGWFCRERRTRISYT